MIRLKGIPVSYGIVIGKAFVLKQDDICILKRPIAENLIQKEIARFKNALNLTKNALLKIQNKIEKEIGKEHANIFSAHLLILEDPILEQETLDKIKQLKYNAEYAFSISLTKLTDMFTSIKDPILKERINDIKDVGKRVIKNLLGKEKESLADLAEESVIFAYDLPPSETAVMKKDKVLAFVTDIGGKTSHTAIMARALEIPAIVGLKKGTSTVENGDLVIVDAEKGTVIIKPDSKTLKIYHHRKEKEARIEKQLILFRKLPSETLDGHVIELAANIEIPEEIKLVKKHGAKGIGLYRTEFLYLNRDTLPSEEEQFQAYKTVAKGIAPYTIIIRTLDIGGDKFLSHLGIPPEVNPFLGLRAIRLCFARPDIFKTQLRAILRASIFAPIKIMFPMISGIEEFRKAKLFVEQVKKDLSKENIPYNVNIPVGIMIETPSAALSADILIKEVDFFSVGTNDLIQYTFAVDRANENLTYIYDPLHPAFLRLIKQIVEAAHKENKEVGICGEMAGNPLYIPILIGLGFDSLSMAPMVISDIKKIIRSITIIEAKKLIEILLKFKTLGETKKFIAKYSKRKFPHLYIELFYDKNR